MTFDVALLIVLALLLMLFGLWVGGDVMLLVSIVATITAVVVCTYGGVIWLFWTFIGVPTFGWAALSFGQCALAALLSLLVIVSGLFFIKVLKEIFG